MSGISDNTTSFTNSFAFVDTTTTASQHPPYNTSPSLSTELRRLSLNPKDKLVQMEYDLTTTPKTFTINDEGIQWTDGTTTHLTALDRISQIANLLPAVQPQATINAEILAVKKTVLVLNDITTPTASIGIQADESLGVGTYYGMNLYNSTDLDFGITSTYPYQGEVVFQQEGVGSTTTRTRIKQGRIDVDDTSTVFSTIIRPTDITSTTFNGALNGNATTATTATNATNATNTTNVGITTDNTAGTYYLPFAKTTGTGNKPLFVDDTTGPLSYNPSTGTMSSHLYTITGTPATSTVASTFGQVGLVKIKTVSVAITGSAVVQNLSFASLFSSTYRNYRLIFYPSTQVSFTAYPTYFLQAFSGTGTMPTVASLFGFEITSAASTVVSPVYTASATISSAPLILAVSCITNRQFTVEVSNVGFANTTSQQVELKCKSVYNNPGIQGASDRTITCASLTGATITGLTIQQSIIGVPNNMTLTCDVYGYNVL